MTMMPLWAKCEAELQGVVARPEIYVPGLR